MKNKVHKTTGVYRDTLLYTVCGITVDRYTLAVLDKWWDRLPTHRCKNCLRSVGSLL